jgi:hypothetical protein
MATAATAPSPTASASAAASASTPASASAAPAPVPPPRAPRRFLAGFPGAEKSPKPSPEEWGKADPYEISRPHRACQTFRIREYVRFTCLQEPMNFHDPSSIFASSADVYGVRVVAGSEEGVEVIKAVWEPKPRPFGKHGVDFVVPVRPGDRRALVIALTIPVWKSMNPDEGTGLAISETWLPGDPGPTIVIH